MKKNIWFIVAFLLLASIAISFAAPPIIDAGIDHRLPNGTGIDPAAWRAAMVVFSQAETTAAIATVAGDLSAHSNAVVGIHGAAAGTRFLTASEVIDVGQIPHIASTGTAVHGLGTMSTQNASAVAITGGTASLTAGLAVDTNTLYVDAANNRVGIATTTPQTALHVVGNETVKGSKISIPAAVTIASNRVVDVPFDYDFGAAASGVATLVVTITTANETGDNDGGVYTAFIQGHATNADAAAGAWTSGAYFSGVFSRAVVNAGSVGVTTAVEALATPVTAAVSAANRNITGVTITTAEVSEYEVQVLITINCSGSQAANLGVRGTIRLISSGFTTSPTITPR